jgi:hypothetical protein
VFILFRFIPGSLLFGRANAPCLSITMMQIRYTSPRFYKSPTFLCFVISTVRTILYPKCYLNQVIFRWTVSISSRSEKFLFYSAVPQLKH